MATTKKTTTKKAPVKKTASPKKKASSAAPSVFEVVAASYMPETIDVDILDGVTLKVRNRIGLGEMMMLVRKIVDSCVDEENGEVHFELFDYVAKMSICTVYCNETAPENNEIGYLASVGSGRMYDLVSQYIDKEQLDNIWYSAREYLKAKSNLFASAAVKITIDMLQKVNDLYDMMSDVAGEVDNGNTEDVLKNIVLLSDKK